MDGSDVVALAGVLSTLAATVFTQWWQRRGENERIVAQRAERREERWLDDRRLVYARFLHGADQCDRALRERFHLLRYGGPQPPGAADGEAGELGSGTAAGLETCAGALGEMRIFAPAEIVRTAVRFLELVRSLEYATSLHRIGQIHAFEGVSNALEGYDEEVALLDDAATDLVAAMRSDLGAAPADFRGLGNIDPTIYGC